MIHIESVYTFAKMAMPMSLTGLQFPRGVTLPSSYIGPGSQAPGPQGTLGGRLGGVTLYENGRNTELETNNSVNKSHRLEPSSRVPGPVEKNLDMHSLVFTCTNKDTVLRYAETATKFMKNDMPSETFSIGALNTYLKSPAGRREYGNHTDCKQFRADWQFGGMVLTAVTAEARDRSEFVCTLTVGKRIRTKNIWSAETRPTGRHDEAYLVVQWHALDEDEPEPMDESKSELFRPRARNTSAIATPKYYLQIVPVMMPPKESVPAERLEAVFPGPVRKYGDCFRVGWVSDVFRDYNGHDTATCFKNVKEGLFSDYNDAETRRRALVKLPDVEIQVAIGGG